MTNAYDKGDVVVVTMTWTNAAGNYVDPSAVVFRYKDPSGNVTTLTYGQDEEVAKIDTGRYVVEIDADEVGEWFVRAESTGIGAAAGEATFRVKASHF